MRGYLQNMSGQAYFVLQRQIPPGAKVELDDAFKVVGKKSGLEDTQVKEFVKFLKTEVLRRGTWEFFEEEGKPFGAPKTKKPAAKVAAPKKERKSVGTSSKKENDARGAGRNMRRNADESSGTEVTPAVIVESSYDQARSLIEKTKDRQVLKKALSLTQHFSGKEQHMRHIMKRLQQVY